MKRLSNKEFKAYMSLSKKSEYELLEDNEKSYKILVTGDKRIVSKKTKDDLILSKLDLIVNKINTIESRIDNLEKRMDNLEKRMDNLEKRMDNLEKRMDNLENRADKIEIDIKEIKSRISVLESFHQEELSLFKTKNKKI